DDLRFPERERRLPILAVERKELLDQRARLGELPRIDVCLDEVVADEHAVALRLEARHADLERLREEAAPPEVAGDGHERFGGNRRAEHLQRLVVESARAGKVARVERVA